MLRPCSISSDRCRINSAFLAYSLLGVGYLAGVLAGQINSRLLMPPLRERGETKVVQPFIGIDRVHIRARKVVEAPQKIKILPHWRREPGFDRTQPSSTGVKLSIYWRLLGMVTVDRHYIRPHCPLAQMLLSWIVWQLLAVYHCLCAMELPFSGENCTGNKALTPQGHTVSTPVLSDNWTWEQALVPRSKSVLYTVVRALKEAAAALHSPRRPAEEMVIKVQFVTDLTPLEDQMRLEGKEDLKSGAFVSSLFYIELHLERETSNQQVLLVYR